MSSLFNLELAIVRWRKNSAAAGIHSPDVLDELESHLREDIRSLTSGGLPKPEAFTSAVSRLGAPESLIVEFRKMSRSSSTVWRICALAGTAVCVAGATTLLTTHSAEKPGVLLAAHITTLTAGYFLALVAGLLTLWYISCQRLLAAAWGGREFVRRLAVRLVQFATGLVLTGLILGMLWTEQHPGRWLTGDPRELGTVSVAAWLIVLCIVQRARHIGHYVSMLLCAAGTLVVSLAWFGAGILAQGETLTSYWIFETWIAAISLFLLLGLVPRRREANA